MRDVTFPDALIMRGSISQLLGHLHCVICDIHEHGNGSQVWVDVLIVRLSKSLDAVKNWNKVFLAKLLDVIIDDQLEAFESVLDYLVVHLRGLDCRLWSLQVQRHDLNWWFVAAFACLPDIHDYDPPSIVLHELPTELYNLFNRANCHQFVVYIGRHHEISQRLQDGRLPVISSPQVHVIRFTRSSRRCLASFSALHTNGVRRGVGPPSTLKLAVVLWWHIIVAVVAGLQISLDICILVRFEIICLVWGWKWGLVALVEDLVSFQ